MTNFQRIAFLLILFFIILLLPGHKSFASGATIYVSNSTANGYVVGSDANNGTSKSTPKLTFSGAYSAATNGDTIIMNDGTYSVGSSFDIAKTITVNSETDYGATLNASGSVYVLGIAPTAGGNVTFGKVVISGQSVTNSDIFLYGETTKYGLVLNGTKLTDFTRQGIRGTAATNLDFTATNIIMTSTVSQGYPVIALAPSSGAALWATGSATINGANINVTSTAAALFGIQLIATTGVTASVQNSTITLSSFTGGAGISIQNIANAVVNNNTITITNSTASNNFDGIDVSAYSTNPVDSSNPQISNNTIHDNGTGGHIIMVGTDGSGGATDGKTNNATVYGNVCYGSTNGPVLHGIFIGSQSGASVYDNKVTNAWTPYLAKLTTGSTIFYNNEAIGSVGGASASLFRTKGAAGVSFINNTGYLDSASSSSNGFYSDDDTTIPTHSTGIVYENNILYFSVQPNWASFLATSNTATYTNNSYYFNGVTVGNGWSYQGTTYATFSAWQTAHESTALNVDPLFTNIGTKDFTLTYLSPVMNMAATATTPTVDFAGNPYYELPDIGAHEYQPPHIMTTDTIDKDAGARIYADGKFRDIATTTGTPIHLKIVPQGGSFTTYGATATRPAYLDVTNITNWTNSHKTWTESNAQTSNMVTDHTIGDLDTNLSFTISVTGASAANISGINGTTCTSGVCQSDGNGTLSFEYNGGYSTHTFDITENPVIAAAPVVVFHGGHPPLPLQIVPTTTESELSNTCRPGDIFDTVTGVRCMISNISISSLLAVTSNTPVFTVNLHLGSNGPQVKLLQQYLNAHGFVVTNLPPTSYFGSYTKKALIKYQKAHNLTPDGIFGPHTRASVNGYL